MQDNRLLDELMKKPEIKNLGLRKEIIVNILKGYNDIAFDFLLENGYVSLGNGMNFEVVQLTDRVHVLRGVPYSSTRKYKLKVTLDDTPYNKIEEYYKKLQEDIL